MIHSVYRRMAGAFCLGGRVRFGDYRPEPDCRPRHPRHRVADPLRKGRDGAPRLNRLVAGRTNQTLKLGDRLRTGKSSRATFRLSNLSVLRVYELTTLEIQPPEQPGRRRAPRFGIRRRLFFQSRQAVGNPVSHALGFGGHSWNGI